MTQPKVHFVRSDMAGGLQEEPGQSDAVPEVLADGGVADHGLSSNLPMGSQASSCVSVV